MNSNPWLIWLKGLVAAIISSAASAVTVAIIDPTDFNFTTGLSNLLAVIGASALVGAALYLKQSPLPDWGSVGLNKINKISIMFVVFAVLLMGAGCGQQSYVGQIRDQGGTYLDISRAARLDALTWYNDAQEKFIENINTMPPTAAADPKVIKWVAKMDDLFDTGGEVLDKWRLANTIAGMETSETEWKKARDALIDAGVGLFTE